MEEKEYLDDRLDDQIKWYSNKSKSNKQWSKGLGMIEIVCAALIPFLAGIGESIPCFQLIIGALGVVIAIAAGMSALNKYQENWIAYRTTAEVLKHEKFMYQASCEPYDGEDRFKRLVRKVESLISKENSQWSDYEKNTGEKT